MNARALLPLGLGLLLAACQSVGPDYRLPDSAALTRSDLQGPLAKDDAPVNLQPLPADWWRLYQDPRLDQLVQDALGANSDLREAAANLARATARQQEAEAAGGWGGGVDIAAERVQESGQAFLLSEKVPVANIGSLALKASYQFDLFGVLQRGAEAAAANAQASAAAADLARISVVAEVVRAYTQVCAANEERQIAQRSLDLQQQGMELVQRLRDAGRGDETQVTRSQTQVKSLRAELPRYAAEREAGLAQLAMLLAKPQASLPRGTADCEQLPDIAQPMPVGDGAALLRRRPDVRQAERRLAAATAGIGVATGELYPDISIGASVGSVGILDDLGEPSTNRWAFGPLLSWTVPAHGARERIVQAEAGAQAALAHFDGVVLDAVRETQTRLAQYQAAIERRDALVEAEASAQRAAEQTHRYFQAGRESFLADLQATRTYTDARAQLAGAQTQVAMARIALFLALGGGWQSTPGT